MTDLPPPRGQQAVKTALCRATEELCALQPPNNVSVREIARRAGVNHGLVHHYFGSKQALLGATMLTIEQDFANAIASITDPAELIAALFDGVQQRPSYPRLLSWMLLEGADPTEYIADFPLVTRLHHTIEAHGDHDEAAARTQIVLTFIAGWSTTHEFLAEAIGLQPDEIIAATEHARRTAITIALADSTESVDPAGA